MHFFPYCFCKVVQFFMGQNTEKWWWGAKTSLRVSLREKMPQLSFKISPELLSIQYGFLKNAIGLTTAERCNSRERGEKGVEFSRWANCKDETYSLEVPRFFLILNGFFTHGKQGSIAIYLIICFSFAKAYVCLGLKLKEINKSPAWQCFIRKKYSLKNARMLVFE